MTSAVDISNLALSHLGDEAEVTAIVPPDGSIQAAQCGRFYPIALGLLLEMHPWTFATKREAVAEVTNPSPDDWAYAYALPSTCLRPLAALYPGVPEQMLGTDSDLGTHPYIVEAGEDGGLVLYTNVETAVLRYIANVTDPSKFSPSFTVALARLLAVYLAGPILKGDKGIAVAQKQAQLFAVEYAQAAALNANIGKRNAYLTRQPSFIAARGLSTLGDALSPFNWP